MPWTLITKIGLGLISVFYKKKEKKEQMNKNFLLFVASYDNQVKDSMELGDAYEDAMEQIKKEEELSKKQS